MGNTVRLGVGRQTFKSGAIHQPFCWLLASCVKKRNFFSVVNL